MLDPADERFDEAEVARLVTRFVQPFYVRLVDWAVADLDGGERADFVQDAATAAHWITEQTVRQLYAVDNWRTKMMASFFVACRRDFIDLAAWTNWADTQWPDYAHRVHLLAYASRDQAPPVWPPSNDATADDRAWNYAALLTGGPECRRAAAEVERTDPALVALPWTRELVERARRMRELMDEIGDRARAEPRPQGRRGESRPRLVPWWHGERDAALSNKNVLPLVELAKAGGWDQVIDLLDRGWPFLSPNRWRPDGTSYYTPLHQVAWHGAPREVADALIERGAWRTLRTSNGRRAVDIAVEKGHEHLVDALTPVLLHELHDDLIASLDLRLAELVESRIRPHITVPLRHPTCEVLTEIPEAQLWYPVPGMYGGFSIALRENHLYVESWSRVAGGSGRGHLITSTAVTEVRRGFV